MQCKYIEYSKLLTNWSLCVQHTVLFFERKTIQWDKENSLFVATHPTTVRYNSREWSMTNWPIIEVPKYSSKNPIGWHPDKGPPGPRSMKVETCRTLVLSDTVSVLHLSHLSHSVLHLSQSLCYTSYTLCYTSLSYLPYACTLWHRPHSV